VAGAIRTNAGNTEESSADERQKIILLKGKE
jgi:hypothetical protein